MVPIERTELGLRRITDAQTMRALTHPTRLALVEALSLHGPMTATEAAEHVGESPSSCSFHLRQLQRYGFVEEAGGGTGRRRPWKMTTLGMNVSGGDDPAAEVAADALSRMLRSRQLERFETWRRTRAGYPKEWRRASTDSEFVFWMTADELEELTTRLLEELVPLHRERLTDPDARPEGSVPVELLLFGYPMQPPS